MAETEFTCPACEATVDPEAVLAHLARTGTADRVVADGADVDLDCPACDAMVTLPSAEVLVKLSADDATLRLLEALREAAPAGTAWEPDLAAALEREREAQRRRDELEATLADLQEKLNRE
jgi:hypothetical protein